MRTSCTHIRTAPSVRFVFARLPTAPLSRVPVAVLHAAVEVGQALVVVRTVAFALQTVVVWLAASPQSDRNVAEYAGNTATAGRRVEGAVGGAAGQETETVVVRGAGALADVAGRR